MKTQSMFITYNLVKHKYPNVFSFYSYINRRLKRGEIKKIKRGLYALVNPVDGEVFANKFQIACALLPDAFLSYHSAIEYYGLATQSHVSALTYLSKTKVNDLTFEDISYWCKKNMCTLQIIEKDYVRIVTLERMVVDSIDNYIVAGGLDEVEQMLMFCPKLDEKKLIEMLNYYNKPTLFQKVGYLLEKYMKYDLSSDFFKYCQSKKSKKIIYLDTTPGFSAYINKWGLMIEKAETPNEPI